MADEIWDVNDSVRFEAAFDVAGTLTDPTTITLKVQDPSGNEDTYTVAGATVTKDSTGIYYKDVTLDEAGTWYYRWEGTGAVVAAIEKNITVQATQF